MDNDEQMISHGKRIEIDIADEMRSSYLAYAMSVIVGRALPDVRDGLKPVHRRSLFAMHEQKNVWNSAYKKSARIVGDVIGKYHPHGDQSVYDTIVRMAQDFSLRYLLVDGQGNFGSVDGDKAAAMRYTEVRMTRLASAMLQDIEKETIDWQDNYDGSEREPSVLPSAFPNLLVNGSGGIAVGMATNMPPHNLQETIDATIALIQNPDISLEALMQIIPGPDFPTGGVILGRGGIRKAYATGRGKVTVRALTDIELDDKGDETAIVITELPYQVNKAKLIEQIAMLVHEKRIEGIRDLRDESDRSGMRVVIELKRGAIGQIVLNKLYKMTPIQSTFGIINLAVVRGQPQVLTLHDLLHEFVHHRRDVVTRRSQFDLRKAEERAHLVEGFLRAIDIIDEIVALIKASPSPTAAKEGLETQFAFSPVQAQAILDMRLGRLTGLEREKLTEELADLQALIAELKAILSDDGKLMEVIVTELELIRDLHGDVRRTRIIEGGADITMEDLIADEDMVVTVTTTGYIKRTPLSEYRTQRRGGKGRSGMRTKDEDNVSELFVATAHAQLLIFTDRGQTYPLKVWEVPKGGITSSGKAIVNLLQLEPGEGIRSIVAIEDLEEEDKYLVFATREGLVKRTALNQFKNIRKGGIRAINLSDDDDLVSVQVANDHDFVILATARGMVIMFSIDDARPMGRATQGTRGIRLRGDDFVVGLDIVDAALMEEIIALGVSEDDDVDEEGTAIEGEELEVSDAEEGEATEEEVAEETTNVLLLTKHGYGKRVPIGQFRVQRRGGLGLRAIPVNQRNGALVSMSLVDPGNDLMAITEGGVIIRVSTDEIRAYSRSAQGVKIVDAGGHNVVTSYAVPASEDEEEVPDGEGTADLPEEALDTEIAAETQEGEGGEDASGEEE